jgi:hypothetical protein
LEWEATPFTGRAGDGTDFLAAGDADEALLRCGGMLEAQLAALGIDEAEKAVPEELKRARDHGLL